MTQLRATIAQYPRLAMTLFSIVIQIPTLLIWRPLILPDEAGFLLNAYQLGAGRPPSGFVYYPGYSLLLAPAAALTTSLESMMWAVHVVNTGLAVVSSLLAFALARRLRPEASTVSAVAIASLTQLYPAFRLFSALALSENLMIPASLLLALLALDLHLGDRPAKPAVLLGLVGGLSFVIHARSISLTLAAGICLILAIRRHRSLMIAPLLVWAATTLAAYVFVNRTISSRGVNIAGNDAGTSLRSILDRSMTLAAVPDWILGGLGQLFYLTIASGGIIMAIAALSVSASRRQAPVSADRILAVGSLVLPLFVLSFGVSVLFMAGKGGDPAIYGRYNEGVLAPVLVLGLSLLGDRVIARRYLSIGLWFVPATAALLVIARPEDFYEPRRQMINITAIHPVTDVFGDIRLGLVSAFGVAIIVAARWGFARHFTFGIVVLAAIWSSIIAYDLRAAVEALDVLDEQNELISAIESVESASGPASCVTIDLVGIGDRWTEANYRLRRDDIDFRYWLSNGGEEPPCPDLIISRRPEVSTSEPGTSLLAVEPGSRIGLFAVPGRVQELALAGRAIVDQPYAPLEPDTPLTVELLDAPTAMRVGDTAAVSVRLTNTSSSALVPHLGLEGPGGINVGLEWRDPTRPDQRLVEPVRVALTGVVWPGDSVVLSGVVSASAAPIAEGDWQLVVGVVQEGRAWLTVEQSTVVEVTRQR